MGTAPRDTVVEYQSGPDEARLARRSRTLLRLTLACAILPLAAGVAETVGYYLTRAESLPLAGLLTLFAGAALLLAGLCLWSVWVFHERRIRRQSWSLVLHEGRWVFGLLVLNLPVAVVCTVVGFWLATTYQVVVCNHTGTVAEHFIVEGPGIREDLGPVPAGARRSTRVSPLGDGALTFYVAQGGTTSGGHIEGYVTGGRGGYARVTLNPGPTPRIEH